MGQPGLFDLSRRYEGLDAAGDPLVAIAAAVFKTLENPMPRHLARRRPALLRDIRLVRNLDD